MTSNLNDPFIRLALLRRAMLHRRNQNSIRRAVARFADSLLNDSRFDEDTAAALLEAPSASGRHLGTLAPAERAR